MPLSHSLWVRGWKYDAKLNLRLNSNVTHLSLSKGGILVGGRLLPSSESGVQSCLLHFAKEGGMALPINLLMTSGKVIYFGTYDAVYDIKPFKREVRICSP